MTSTMPLAELRKLKTEDYGVTLDKVKPKMAREWRNSADTPRTAWREHGGPGGYLDHLAGQIKEHGITEPIQIGHRPDGSQTIYDGTHRALVAHDQGIDPVPVEHFDMVKNQHYAMGQAGPDYDNLTFHHGDHDLYPFDKTLYAHHPEHGNVGRLHYREERDKPAWTGFPKDFNAVSMMHVEPEHRRRGVADQLMHHFEHEVSKDIPISHGSRKPDGNEWSKSHYNDPQGGKENRFTGETEGSKSDWTLNGKPWNVQTQKFRRMPRNAVQTPPEGLSFHAEDFETGGTKHPVRTHLRAIHPEHGQVGAVIYYPPKRSNGRVAIDNLHVENDQRRQGIGSALMDEVQRRHPDSSIDHGDRTNDGESWWSGYTKDKKVKRGRTAGWDVEHDDTMMAHRPGAPDDAEEGTAAPAHDLTKVYPKDVYTHPHFYGTGEGLHGGPKAFKETVDTLRKIRGNPEAPVTMYRSLPPEHAHKGFRTGDWVSIHPEYARGHGLHNDDSNKDWPVIKHTVPAKHLWNNGDSLDEFGYHGPHLDKPEVHFEGGRDARIQHHSRFTPTQRVFTHTCGLDHRLFDQNNHLKPEVRRYILASVTRMWGGTYTDWSKWAVVYFAGSEASEWTSDSLEGNNDFDVLIGVDYQKFRQSNPQFRHASNQAITDQMNLGFRAYNGPHTLIVDGISWGPFDRTTYVNPNSYDIRAIKPYAAYNVSKDTWAVDPPHLPHWSLEEAPKPVQSVLRACDRLANDVLKLPEPLRTQQGAALFDAWHSDRSRAFGPNGEGWYDIANLREKWLDQEGTWAQLLELKKRFNQGLGAAPADWSNTPTGYK